MKTAGSIFLIFSICLLALLPMIAYLVAAHRRIRQAGVILYEIGTPSASVKRPWVFVGVFLAYWAVAVLLEFGGPLGEHRIVSLLLRRAPIIALLVIFLFGSFYPLPYKDSIREGGIVGNRRLLRWDKIESVEWAEVKPSHWTLTVNRKGRWAYPRIIRIKIPLDKKTITDEALRKVAQDKIKIT